jgi:hypothetical protein
MFLASRCVAVLQLVLLLSGACGGFVRSMADYLPRAVSRNRKSGESDNRLSYGWNSYSNCVGGDVASTHVRYRNKSGKHMLVSSFSYFDPKQPLNLADLEASQGLNVVARRMVFVTDRNIQSRTLLAAIQDCQEPPTAV